MNNASRYDGKPLLRLLECYVLRAIGELSADDASKLASMAPQLGRVYSRAGAWTEILASELALPENMPELIVQMWRRNQDIAKANGVTLSPEHFAQMFVDQNFPQ